MPRLNSKCQSGASKRKQRKQWEAMQASLQGSLSKYLKRTSDCGISASSMPTNSTGNTATQDESAGTVQDESDTDQGSEQESNLNKECKEQDVLDENQEFGDQEEFEENQEYEEQEQWKDIQDLKEPEQELEEELDRNQEYEEQEEWNNSQDMEEPEQELEEEMDGDQEQWDQNEKEQPDQRNMNIDEVNVGEIINVVLMESFAVPEEEILVVTNVTGNDSTTNSEEVRLPSRLQDIGNWPANLSACDRKQIIIHGPVTMSDDFQYPTDATRRKFSKRFFYRQMNNGETFRRSWLVYSAAKDALFCFCCKLFSTTQSVSSLATDGCSDWKRIGHVLSEHESSKNHLSCQHLLSQVWKQYNAERNISHVIVQGHQLEVTYWRNLLRRLLKIIQFLAEHNISLRGTGGHEKIGDPKNGPFLGLVELIAEFDPVLSEHIRKINCQQLYHHYLGKHIQNELIELVGNRILSTILHAANRNKYYSIILDCTPDISHTEQMSLVIRYVDIEAANVKIEEHFLCFIEVSSTTSENLCNIIVQKLEEVGLPLMNCRGQAYDNGANMSGKKSGLQKRILDLNPQAFFLPCASHTLNLVLCDSAKSCIEFFTFFGNIQKIYAILSSSTKRWNILKKNCKKVVKHPSDTRWESKISSVEAIKMEFLGIVYSLEEVFGEATGNATSCAEIQGILTAMQTFEFALCTEIWFEVLSQANIVSKYLQKVDIDLTAAVALIDGFLEGCVIFAKMASSIV